jgi:hypothetical protein
VVNLHIRRPDKELLTFQELSRTESVSSACSSTAKLYGVARETRDRCEQMRAANPPFTWGTGKVNIYDLNNTAVHWSPGPTGLLHSLRRVSLYETKELHFGKYFFSGKPSREVRRGRVIAWPRELWTNQPNKCWRVRKVRNLIIK